MFAHKNVYVIAVFRDKNGPLSETVILASVDVIVVSLSDTPPVDKHVSVVFRQRL